jgi:hypothetical protein
MTSADEKGRGSTLTSTGLLMSAGVLCLSHAETCRDRDGNVVTVDEGMRASGFDEDVDDQGNRDELLASGTVERPPDWLARQGSRWVLRINERGVRHESDEKS